MKEQLRILKIAWAPMSAAVVLALSPLAVKANCNEATQVGDYLGRGSWLEQVPPCAAAIRPPADVHINVSDVLGRSGVAPRSEVFADQTEAQSLAKAPVSEIQRRSGASFALRAPKASGSQYAGHEQ